MISDGRIGRAHMIQWRHDNLLLRVAVLWGGDPPATRSDCFQIPYGDRVLTLVCYRVMRSIMVVMADFSAISEIVAPEQIGRASGATI